MDLRYRLAAVTGAGSGLGREVAVALSRAGAGVLVADRDPVAAEATAELVRAARVGAWTVQADLAVDADLTLLAARARDLGGMDLLVTTGACAGDPTDRPQELDVGLRAPVRLTRLFVGQLPELRGRRDGTPAVVHVSPEGTDAEEAAAHAGLLRFTTGCTDPATTGGARVMAVVPVAAPQVQVVRTVVDLLRSGEAGRVVDLGPVASDRVAVAALVRTFFEAFTSGSDVGLRVDALQELFLPGAVVVRTLGGLTTYDVEGFLAPRRALLEGGTLTGFSEWEVSGHTEVFGDVASHVCRYEKAWDQDGEHHTGRGVKTLQLVRTPQGWRISALAWADER